MPPEILEKIETAIKMIVQSDKQIGEVILIVRGAEIRFVDVRCPIDLFLLTGDGVDSAGNCGNEK